MLSINTNLSSLIAQQSMSSATNKLNQAIERMTTGYKINGAKDNAANYSISTNMTTKINSYMVAEDNVAMGLDMLSTANGSLDQISDKLTRLRALATQASNGTYGQQSLTAINSEANALVDEINRIYSTAEYNGKKLFAGDETNATPAVAAYGARAASTNTTYTDEEVAAMIELTDDVTTITEGGEYAIYNAEQLAHLAELINSGVYDMEGDATFVLAGDVDLSGINWTPIGNESHSFHGTFDGNGHVISNLTINRPTEGYQGLFGYVYVDGQHPAGISAEIMNVGLENVNIAGANPVGGLVGKTKSTCLATLEISNCYVTGSISGSDCVGGLVGSASTNSGGTITFNNNYVTANVNATSSCIAGFIGDVYNESGSITFINNYATGDVSGSSFVGGFAGEVMNYSSDPIVFTNNYATGDVSGDFSPAGFIAESYISNLEEILYTNNYATGNVIGPDAQGFCGSGSLTLIANNASVQADRWVTQMTVEEIAATYTPEMMGFTEANGWTIVDGQPVLAFSMAARNANSGGLSGSNYVTLQVGINADSYSQIGLEFGFALDGIEGLRQIGLDTSTDYLSTLDNMLDVVSAKATEYGAAQNRLESALDEIAIQYDNLVSSRSTLRDADIAEVSSQYIQQQILQQASATLLATANQSPSIALQLI